MKSEIEGGAVSFLKKLLQSNFTGYDYSKAKLTELKF